MVIVRWDGYRTYFQKTAGTPIRYISSYYKNIDESVNIIWNSLCTVEVKSIPLTRLKRFYIEGAVGADNGYLLNITSVLIEVGENPDESIYCIVLTPLEENELLKIAME